MRSAATALFGAPPTSSYAHAEAQLLAADAYAAAPGGGGPMMATRLKLAQT